MWDEVGGGWCGVRWEVVDMEWGGRCGMWVGLHTWISAYVCTYVHVYKCTNRLCID